MIKTKTKTTKDFLRKGKNEREFTASDCRVIWECISVGIRQPLNGIRVAAKLIAEDSDKVFNYYKNVMYPALEKRLNDLVNKFGKPIPDIELQKLANEIGVTTIWLMSQWKQICQPSRRITKSDLWTKELRTELIQILCSNNKITKGFKVFAEDKNLSEGVCNIDYYRIIKPELLERVKKKGVKAVANEYGITSEALTELLKQKTAGKQKKPADTCKNTDIKATCHNVANEVSHSAVTNNNEAKTEIIFAEQKISISKDGPKIVIKIG